ncbi:tRNA-dependent cyclodipeptide synthase [Streptomyces sp. AJS327]|uniref:tRNA-dependent cyclodipeptide synthase n=1 Tax=Streptomyces sp. AJS327 TaxID=2545265 RepID=UPI0015DF817D|nr:tRNA-dependent cyclodipeptide synthase [Streptomyces sp. AJS327]MBA0049428.1 tRNA-dependent cyclodipeptide synthase [Streptomyces sp. AJS327]
MDYADPLDLVADFVVQPFDHRSRMIWRRGHHVLIGVSTGNSYFSADRMVALLRWAQRNFQQIDLVCADTHIDSMLIANGEEPEEAARRAKRRVKSVLRRVRQATAAVSDAAPLPRHHLLSDFLQVPEYRVLRERVDEALRGDQDFIDACEFMVTRFLLAKEASDSDEPDPRQLRAGLDYLANELPFFVDTPSILNVPSSVSSYHLFPPVVAPLFGRETGLRAVEDQAFMVVRPASAPGAAPGAVAGRPMG